MKLYDNVITECLALCDSCKREKLDTNQNWPLGSERDMILRSDMAYELGADVNSGVGTTMVTGSVHFVPEDSIELIGPDLSELSADSPYARITIVRVKEEMMQEGQALYSAIRKLEYTRYHFAPEGYMMRASTAQNRESVRVSKKAHEKGITFANVGGEMIAHFKKNATVEAVRMIYITDPEFDYKALLEKAKRVEDITKTLDHIANNVIMDCGACKLQEICDEVEGLKELHFGSETN